MKYMVGVDVGGTFTDITLINTESQEVFNHKVRSTPSDPSMAILTGVKEILEDYEIPYSEVDYLAHGTTVATNALIEKKGVKTALLITEGFKDLIEIRDQTRPSLYQLKTEKPEALVGPRLRYEAFERLFADGKISRSLDEKSLREILMNMKEQNVDALAICFLFSFINPEHEIRALKIAREILPDAFISVSHKIVPEFREYPRVSTTILNAYLGPIMQRYLNNFEKSVKEAGIRVDPYITQSNGGILSIPETVKMPVRTAISGPSAGVVAAAQIGKLSGHTNIITFDMGGTSADISLIENAEPLISMERKIEGWPARLPMLDIITIGAGGGSIARIDKGGALKVGPESAGAVPGPACYMVGGTEPTVTDANVVLGRINPKTILGGRMEIDSSLANKVICEKISNKTSLTELDAAVGIIDVVNANMERAIRVVSVERGYDPQEFTLMAFGGAGPLHAAALAKELGIPFVLVPPSAGTLCSLGLLLTDIRMDYVRSKVLNPSSETVTEMREIYAELKREGQNVLEKEGIEENLRSYPCWVDARYQRQNYELRIPVYENDLTSEGLQGLVERFHNEHEKAYGYSRQTSTIEFVNFRLTAVGVLPKAPIPKSTDRKTAGELQTLASRDSRKVYFTETQSFVNCPVYQREDFYPQDTFSGPAIVEQMDATTVVPPASTVRIDKYGNMLIDVRS